MLKTLNLRTVKGELLLNTEVDANFVNLDDALALTATDFYGTTDPSASVLVDIAVGMKWANPSTGWVSLCTAITPSVVWQPVARLLDKSLPQVTELPSGDIGSDVHLIGVGPYTWDSQTNEYSAMVKNASESVPGIAKIATENNTTSYTGNTTIVTPHTLGLVTDLRGKTSTGTTNFSKVDNKMGQAGMVTTLGLEVGDVIKVIGSNLNDALRSVESIVDSSNVIVNYEHRNSAGSLSLEDETGTNCTIQLFSKWYNAPPGLGQARVQLPLTLDTVYQNTTGRTIVWLAGAATIQCSFVSNDGVTWHVVGSANSGTRYFSDYILEQGKYFKITSDQAVASGSSQIR